MKTCPVCGQGGLLTGATHCKHCGSAFSESGKSTIATTQQKKSVVSFWRRLGAFIIDMIILNFVAGVIAKATDRPDLMPTWWLTVWGVIGLIAVVLPVIYFVWPYSAGGQTLGKKILGIQVVSIDGSPLNWRKGILRSLGYIISFPFCLGFLWSIWDADKQAWHDKIAGTCVVWAWSAQEQGILDPSKARRRQRRWLIGLGIPALLIMLFGGAWVVSFMWDSMAEVRGMGPWPGPDVSPRKIVTMDLSHVGLKRGPIQYPRDEETWAGGSYDEGVLITYESGEKSVVGLWALRYGAKETAGNDFALAEARTQEKCRVSTGAKLKLWDTGVIHCGVSNAYDKIFWNDGWLVEIVALEGTEFTPVVLVDKVRDALAAHWVEIANPLSGNLPTSLVAETMFDLALAIKARDFTGFYNNISALWQKDTTPKELYEIFKSFSDQNMDLTVLQGFNPLFTEEPFFDENNWLVLQGYYPTQPSIVYFRLEYLNENTAWKLIAINVDVKPEPLPNRATSIPSELTMLQLVDGTMFDLALAIKARDFTGFYNNISVLWQRNSTPEELYKAFKEFSDNNIDLTGFQEFEPIFTEEPFLDANGYLVLQGYYPTQPAVIYFTLEYLNENTAWKLIAINVDVKPDER